MTDAKNPDIDMTDEYAALIPGAKHFPSPVHGWSLEKALMGHKLALQNAVKANPSAFLGAVVLSNDFKDRGRAAGAIGAIMETEGLGRQQVYPATPAIPNTDARERLPLSMPWVNLIPNVTPELRQSALARQSLQGLYEEEDYCFYFIDLTFAQPPFLVLTYWQIADGAQVADVKGSLLAKMLEDPRAIDAAKDHSYMPNETKPDILFRTMLAFATFRTFDYNLSNVKRTVWSIVIPPLSTDPAHTAALQHHLMESGFSFDVGFLGTAVPWRGPKGELMSCSACHSIDHYRHNCPILTSDAYLLRRGTHGDLPPAWNATSRLPTSLNDDMDTSGSAGPSNHMGVRNGGRERRTGGFNSSRNGGGSRDWQSDFRNGGGSRNRGPNSRYPY
ncbi:hypothetical protein C8R47DRAFT_1169479 [Mycena vitilis]|nr:hypothetical protein C8R47DRAFT_1169479 [Mycena vitilis]